MQDIRGREPTPTPTAPLLRPRPGVRPRREICVPVCPACGGLECLCRPRFFAGQLLTEQDLNRLDRYIRGKHRLHNRHLHGWGVVCGLEVTCHECAGYVRVGAGYGLSPCGDDIVVCEDDSVPVCDLIRRCAREERHRRECEPPRRHDPSCEEGDETWVLAICYEEKPSRGVTALRSAGCTCGRCSGASASCSGGACGCGYKGKSHDAGGHNGNGNGNGTTRTGARRPPAQCEPTVICEGYRYEVYRAPLGDAGAESRGALVDRFEKCARPYFEFAELLGQNQPSTQPTRAEQHRLCCMMKRRLREILLERPVHNCELLARLDAVSCPPPDARMTDAEWNDALNRATQALIMVWVEGLLACLCSVLLPPCPGPADDNCIPLATVTVRRRDCHILRVCNWTADRKFATTFPSLQYWLSILPFGRELRRQIEDFCCRLLGRLQARASAGQGDSAQPAPNPGPSAAGFAFGTFSSGEQPDATGGIGAEPIFAAPAFTTMHSRDLSMLIIDAVLDRSTTPTPDALFRGVMATGRAGAEGVLQEVERSNMSQYLLANSVFAPLVRAMVPAEIAGLAAADARAAGADLESLRSEVEALRHTLSGQQQVIDRLSERLAEG